MKLNSTGAPKITTPGSARAGSAALETQAPAQPGGGWVTGRAQSAPRVVRQQLPLTTASPLVDGHFVGAGAIFPASADPATLPAVPPSHGAVERRVFYVNGVATDPVRQHAELQALANHLDAGLVGVHNATHGLAADARDFVRDRLSDPAAAARADPSIGTVTRLITRAVERGEPIELVGHSQGAVVISRALEHLEREWRGQGLPAAAIRARLSHVCVTTFAGAARRYPDGPRYTHYVNRSDAVPMFFGAGLPGAKPGANAVVRRLDFRTREPELWVPPVRQQAAQAFNAETHGLVQYLRVIRGETLAPVPEPLAP